MADCRWKCVKIAEDTGCPFETEERDRPQCDVFLSEDPVRSAVLKKKGLSAPYQSPAAKGLRPGGLGIMMTQQMIDELVYNEARNEVVLVKYL